MLDLKYFNGQWSEGYVFNLLLTTLIQGLNGNFIIGGGCFSNN